MNKFIPEKIEYLATKCPFPLYAVGGICRDFLAGLSSAKSDIDICAPVSAESFVACAIDAGFKVNAVYKNTGTVKISCGECSAEFTSFRSDKYVRGKHSPVEVTFTDDIVSDARRRDFKCNAVYYDIKSGQFADPLGAINDINNKLLSTVAPADKVFGEDGLRLMRLCRQAAETGFKPTEECFNGAKKNARLIRDISAERIWAELERLLTADRRYGVKYGQYEGLKIMHGTGVLAEILPELTLGENMLQRKDFHDHDVLEHSLRCVKYSHPTVRLAALLHDIGKPRCMLDNGKYATHEIVGAEIADGVCARLKISKKLREETVKLVRLHMYDLGGITRENKVRRFIVEHYAVLDKLLLLKQADYSACKDDLAKAPCVKRWEDILENMKKEGAPLTLKQLDISGDKLIGAGISPGETAKTLKFLLLHCAVNPKDNRQDKLIRLALSNK